MKKDAAFYGKHKAADIEKKVKKLVTQLSADEKISMVAGSGYMETQSFPDLGIPCINMTDGPMGPNQKKATAFLVQYCL